jgi:hypothetical protein
MVVNEWATRGSQTKSSLKYGLLSTFTKTSLLTKLQLFMYQGVNHQTKLRHVSTERHYQMAGKRQLVLIATLWVAALLY